MMSEDNKGPTAHFLESAPEKHDKLDQIFDAQEKFRKLMGKGQDCIVDLMDEAQKGQLIYDHCQAIASELQELINCIYWKSWTKEAKEGKRYMFRNKENLKEEIADILCFLGDICAAVDMDAEELAAINVRKTEVNINRQLTKYAMDTKDGKDSEAIWQQIKDGDLKSITQKLIEDPQIVIDAHRKHMDELNNHSYDLGQSGPPILNKKYLKERERVIIYESLSATLMNKRFSVTLESTNKTEVIELSIIESSQQDSRAILMRKISEIFKLTEPFEIVEA